MAMNPTASNAKGSNTHTYPAYDYPVAIGTGLVAVKGGTITDLPGQPTRRLMGNLTNTQHWSGYVPNAQNSGNVVTISHGKGEYTCYLHASPYDVNAYRGQRVNQGEVFARSGHNGWSTGPHLHFEVWTNGGRIDPGPWLKNISTQGGVMITKEMEDVCSILATGSRPGPNYNYRFTGTSDVNGMLSFWATYASTITPGLEKTLAKVATGSVYGAGYNSPFQGKPLASIPEMQKMADFWLSQRTVPGFEPVTEQLFRKT